MSGNGINLTMSYYSHHLWITPPTGVSLPSSSSFTVLASLSASSFSFFSNSLERFSSALAPAPILLFPAWFPLFQKPSVRKNGSRSRVAAHLLLSDRCLQARSWCSNCPQLGIVWVFFPVTGKDLGLQKPTWPVLTNGGQGQYSYRAKVWREGDIYHCRSAITFRVLCCAQRKMNIGSSAYPIFLGSFKGDACITKRAWFKSCSYSSLVFNVSRNEKGCYTNGGFRFLQDARMG